MDQQQDRSQQSANTTDNNSQAPRRRRRRPQESRSASTQQGSRPAQGSSAQRTSSTQRRRKPQGQAARSQSGRPANGGRPSSNSQGQAPRPQSGRPSKAKRPAQSRPASGTRSQGRPARSGQPRGSAQTRTKTRNAQAPQRTNRRPAAQQREASAQLRALVKQYPFAPIVAGIVCLILVGLLIFGITRCTSKPAQSNQQAQQAQQTSSSNQQTSNSKTDEDGKTSSKDSTSTDDSTSKSSSSKVTANVPDPAWKDAAEVPELTSDGTDPTAIAAQMEAERVAENAEDGYEGVEDPWLDGGYFTTGDKDLDEQVKAFCDKFSTDGSSASDNAYNTFCNITWSDYDEWAGNQHPHTYDWTVQYAKDFFDRGGNCFSMASAVQWCLRYFGYSDAHAELTYQERQGGGWLDHGLTWVTDIESGEIRLVDSEMSSKGWMMQPHSYNVEILDPTGDWEPRSSAFDRSEMT